MRLLWVVTFKNTPSTSWLAWSVIDIAAPLRGTIADKKSNPGNVYEYDIDVAKWKKQKTNKNKKIHIVLSALFSNRERDAAGDDLSVKNLSRANSSSDLNTNSELNPTANHLGTQSDWKKPPWVRNVPWVSKTGQNEICKQSYCLENFRRKHNIPPVDLAARLAEEQIWPPSIPFDRLQNLKRTPTCVLVCECKTPSVRGEIHSWMK